MAQIGDTFRTGEKAPVSGDYEYVRHIDTTTTCTPTPEERQITLSKGETFPPHRSCNKGVIWKLIRIR
ncbi:MAG: YjzC family protein [Dehalococcoidia bacterium]|nr:YjzC family protein [Dehalococcoidia bacterium]